MSRRGRPPHPDILTPREWEALALLRQGLSNDEIAQRLGISLSGAKYHVSEILSKLGVSSREEAALWQPEQRPWWMASFAPLGFLWHKASFGWLSPVVTASSAIVVTAGIGLLVWGLLRTGGAGDRTVITNPSASVGDLLACYGKQPASAESLVASQSLRGARISVGGNEVGKGQSEQLLSSLRDTQAVHFGVRGTPGTRIGEPGRLAETTLDIDLNEARLALNYVRPGPLAPYGLLFDPALINSWDYIDILDPPGYVQLACTVPPEFDQVMADLGYKGYAPVDILEIRPVPVSQAHRECCIVEQIDVWKDDEPRQVLSGVTEDALFPINTWGRRTTPTTVEIPRTPVEPYTGERLNVEVQFTGIDPFPEAARPTEYYYYPGDSSASGRGVLVPITGIFIYNSGGEPGEAFYPEPYLDQLLRNASSAGQELRDPDSP